jgi:hypothetical protein
MVARASLAKHKAAQRLASRDLVCNGWRNGARCTATTLCDAHIIPRAFARSARQGKHLFSISSDGIRKPGAQDGVYDRHILCSTCDGALGDFDKYAIEFCRALPVAAIDRGAYWEVLNEDGDKLAKFALAVLWRASLSRRPDFAEISLGAKYEPMARDILFGVRPLSSMPAFEVLLTRLHTTVADMNGFFALPQPMDGADYRCYGFIVGSLHIVAKVDNRLFPCDWLPHIVNGASIVRGLDHRFEQTSQFRALAQQVLRRPRS